MNKYQRAKSRMIKRYIRSMKICGYGELSYKEAKRDFHYHKLIINAAIHPANSGYRPEILIIDESTPIKESPFITRYLGKFDIKEASE